MNIYYYKSKDSKELSICGQDDKISMCEKIISSRSSVARTPTIYSLECVYYGEKDVLREDSIVKYGQFKSTNKEVIKLMKKLDMKFGQKSFYLARESWRTNRLVTYIEMQKMYNSELPDRYRIGTYKNYMSKTISLDEWKARKSKAVKEAKRIYNI